MLTRSTIPSGAIQTDAPTPRHSDRAEKALTADEADALKRLERVIEGGVLTFLEVGAALLRIRDERLYRAAQATFDAYCRERWNFSKTQANRFIAASNVAKNLAPIGVVPTSESQVRLLASFDAPKQIKVFERAAKQAGGADKVTAQGIEKAATQMKLITPSSAATRPTADTVKRDAVIAAFHEWADKNWDRVSQLSANTFLREVKSVVMEA